MVPQASRPPHAMSAYTRPASTDLLSRPKHSRRTRSLEFDCRTLPTTLTAEHPQASNTIDCLNSSVAFMMPAIDTRWSHRIGSPALTVPPFDTVGAQTTHEWKDVGFRSEVISILEHAQVRVLGYDLVRRVRPGQELSQTPLTRLVNDTAGRMA